MQNMIITEMKKHLEGEDSDDEYEVPSTTHIVVGPLHIMYDSDEDDN
jgi:hypothetical protein